ncbi:D-aminoacyl-tRNA deacylase [Desulfobulbus sp.]|uniref:D-aminoacyl-tRNA deacylase n=1 Tax=Desulfobulbus sp. TaxID=895 RepID=UPI0027B94F04|nr:D-aminoacyl-tRNA deacylase [Desulfobulbus sp.]
MRAVVQRVSTAQVEVDQQTTGAIAEGLLVLLGVHRADTEKDLTWMVEKIQHLRIFEDDQGLMNRSLTDIKGELLVVSQFTLYGDCRKGRRPSWNEAAPPELARSLYDQFIDCCRLRNIPVQAGVFQAMMQVSLTNSGPVTILLDSHKTF